MSSIIDRIHDDEDEIARLKADLAAARCMT